MAEPKRKDYVSNTKLLETLIWYKNDKISAAKDNLPSPRIPEYVGECLLKIAKNLAHKPNFNGYTYKEDMIGDAILNCVAYIDNFDPEKSKNPFSYFTQIIYFAFLRRIEGEKKQAYIKCKIMDKNDFTPYVEHPESGEMSQKNSYVNFISETIDETIKNFEDKKKRAKEKKLLGLDKFTEPI